MNLIKFRIFRGRNNRQHTSIWNYCILFLIFGLFHCAERDRTNIFDPAAGIDTLNLSLDISSADSSITLRWSSPGNVGTEGFKLYRKSETDNNFSLLASLPTDQFEYEDSNIEFYTQYQYYLTVQGQDNESPPTHVVKVTPGPISFVILDRLGFALYWVSYDLGHLIRTQYTIWTPENLAHDPLNDLYLVTYPVFNYFEVYSGNSGRIEEANSDFPDPFDCIYNTQQYEFWITDSSGLLFSLEPASGRTDIIDRNLIRPTQIIQSENNIFVLDMGARQVIIYNKSGDRTGSINQSVNNALMNPAYIHYAESYPHLYIIDRPDSIGSLYAYSLLSGTGELVFVHKFMNVVKTDIRDNSIWISINETQNSSVLQLSPDGVRLQEISGFSSISDFRINFESNSIIVADPVDDIVKHIRLSDLGTIGVFKESVNPMKVYSE